MTTNAAWHLLQDVKAARADNGDVFVMPTPEWSVLYTHEELSELMRALQQQRLPEHLRGSARRYDLQLEWGQVLMMHLTTALLLDIDVSAGFNQAIELIYERSAAKRATLP